MVSERGWGGEDLNHILELFPVSLEAGAVAHASLDSLQEISNLGDSIDDLFWVFGLEVFESILGILEDSLSISDARVDVIKTFGVKSTLKNTSNDIFELLSVDGSSLWGKGSFNLLLDILLEVGKEVSSIRNDVFSIRDNILSIV